MACCKLGIKATKNCNGVNSPLNGVLWSKKGLTKTMLHTAFDELAVDVTRLGQIRTYGCKSFEKYVKELRQPLLANTFLDTDFCSKCTQIFGDDVSLKMVIEYHWYVCLFVCLYLCIVFVYKLVCL